MDNDTTKDRIKDNALPRFGNVITTPTAEQYKTALKWLKEQYPSAAKISPQLFDEGNMPPHLEYMGLDIDGWKLLRTIILLIYLGWLVSWTISTVWTTARS